jgi:HSP20 family molecular chaperone IbpA
MTDSIATRPSTELRRRESEYVLRPAATVFEDGDGITLQLDMPGVNKDRLSVQSDKSSLTIEGEMQIPTPEGMQALYAEVQSTKYRRSFALSGELDPDKTEANLSDGVLTVRIPRRAELRPRRIEVKVG